MTKAKSNRFIEILHNKTAGSSELVVMLNDYFLTSKISVSEIRNKIYKAKSSLGHFQAVNDYLNTLEMKLKNINDLKNFLVDHSAIQVKNIERIFKEIYPELLKVKSIITLSRSGNLLTILKLWHQTKRNIKVVICESRPRLEGRSMAEELAASDIKTLLITDAMMSLYVPQVDAAIIGADVILKNGNVVNKVGSKSLALLCREYNKPFFVVSSQNKFSKRSRFNQKNEDPNEILSKSKKNLSASNIYFEEVEKKLISKIFTN